MVKYSSGALDATFSALADPTRRAILARLARGESSVTGLAEPFNVSLPAISKHIRVLEKAGLLAREKDGRVHRCFLVAGRMKDAGEWIARYLRYWEDKFDALAYYLNESKRKEERRWSTPDRAQQPRSASREPSRPRGKKSSGRGPTRKN